MSHSLRLSILSVALLRVVVPGAGFHGSFFGPKLGESQKEKLGLCCKMSRFSVQKYVKTKKNKSFCRKSVGFQSYGFTS